MYVGSAAAATTSVTLPTGRAIGDLELMWVFRSGSTTTPTIPSGWLVIATATTTSTWCGLYYRICTSASDTSGTFTSASGLACGVYRGVYGLGAKSTLTTAVGTTVTFAAIASPIQTVRSWFVGCAGHRTATAASMAVAPTGMINRTGAVTAFANINDTNGGKTSWSSATITASASSGNGGIVVELLMDSSTWDPYYTNTAVLTLSTANTKVACTGSPTNHGYGLGTLGKFSGKWVYAYTPTLVASSDSGFGLATHSFSTADASFSGKGTTGVVIFDNYDTAAGQLSQFFNGSVTQIGDGSQQATTVKNYLAVDLTGTDPKFWVKVNNGNWNDDASANPDTGVGGLTLTGMGVAGIYPLTMLSTSSPNDSGVFDGSISGTSTSGLTQFTAWDVLPLSKNPLVNQAINRASTF